MKLVLRFYKSSIFRLLGFMSLGIMGFSGIRAQTLLAIGPDGGDFTWNAGDVTQKVFLPVRLLSFDAVKRNTGVEVTWRATNENEGRSYRVERSSNGQDFEVVNTVETLGAGSYSFLDKTQKPGRIAYYRLEMISVDGEKYYSNIKTVILDGRGELTLAPNPIRNGNMLATFAPTTQTAAVRVINMSGQVMQSQQLAPFNEQIFINTNNLRPGVYMLQIITGSDIQTSRFIKK